MGDYGLMKYKELIQLIEKYINGSISKEVSQKFCDEFMDAFYADQDELEKEVSKEIYEIFDDLNLVCDSYEPNVQIREMDRYCIDEMLLKNRVVGLYKKVISIGSSIRQAGSGKAEAGSSIRPTR